MERSFDNIGDKYMEWLSFWLMKHVAEFLLFTAVLFLIMCFTTIPTAIKQWRCKHDGGVNETTQNSGACEFATVKLYVTKGLNRHEGLEKPAR